MMVVVQTTSDPVTVTLAVAIDPISPLGIPISSIFIPYASFNLHFYLITFVQSEYRPDTFMLVVPVDPPNKQKLKI